MSREPIQRPEPLVRTNQPPADGAQTAAERALRVEVDILREGMHNRDADRSVNGHVGRFGDGCPGCDEWTKVHSALLAAAPSPVAHEGPGIDVDRLALAIHLEPHHYHASHEDDDEDAAYIAAEYARLAAQAGQQPKADDPSDA